LSQHRDDMTNAYSHHFNAKRLTEKTEARAAGAPYTISSLLRDEVARIAGERLTTAELRTGKYRRAAEPLQNVPRRR
jgi:hypothetical protein